MFRPDKPEHISPISQPELPYNREQVAKLELKLERDIQLRAVIEQLRTCTSAGELSSIVMRWNEHEGRLWTGAHVEKLLRADHKSITVMMDREENIRIGAIWS